jgi:membrane associated rhomboid family serine protease
MFTLSITLVITALIVIASIQAFNNANLYYKLIFNPYQVVKNGEYYRIFSHVLLHADWAHLAFNMFAFFSFGRFLEQYFTNVYGLTLGRVLFLALFLGGTLIASIPALRKHGNNSSYNAVGASGAVSAVMMAFMIMFPLARISFFFAIPMPAYVGAILFLVFEHFMQKRGGTNIAHDAHIWGALGGLVFVVLLDYHYLINFFASIYQSILG